LQKEPSGAKIWLPSANSWKINQYDSKVRHKSFETIVNETTN